MQYVLSLPTLPGWLLMSVWLLNTVLLYSFPVTVTPRAARLQPRPSSLLVLQPVLFPSYLIPEQDLRPVPVRFHLTRFHWSFQTVRTALEGDALSLSGGQRIV